jgi:putative hydrolase of the HAD superfamily
MSRIQAVVFDLDDTLYPEREYAWSGFRAVAAAFTEELEDPNDTVADLQRLFDSEHRSRVFDALLKERFGEADHSLVARMVEVYRQHPPIITPYVDVDAALTRLQSRYKLGLITDGRPEAQWAKIDALQLRPRFDGIIVTGDLKPDSVEAAPVPSPSFCKPHRRAFEEMARQLEVSANACVYVADNVSKDFVAPNALGWLTVRIARADGVYCDAICAERGEAQHTVKSLDELDALLT